MQKEKEDEWINSPIKTVNLLKYAMYKHKPYKSLKSKKKKKNKALAFRFKSM